MFSAGAAEDGIVFPPREVEIRTFLLGSDCSDPCRHLDQATADQFNSMEVEAQENSAPQRLPSVCGAEAFPGCRAGIPIRQQ